MRSARFADLNNAARETSFELIDTASSRCNEEDNKRTRSDIAEASGRVCFGVYKPRRAPLGVFFSCTNINVAEVSIGGNCPARTWQSEGGRLSLQRQKPGSAAACALAISGKMA